MSKDFSDVVKAESCFIVSSNPRFVHDLFLSSYVVKTKPQKESLFVTIRIVTDLADQKREEKSNILPDFFGEDNSLWLRDFILTNQCSLKLAIWNPEEEINQKEKSNYIYFAETEDNCDKNILFFADSAFEKRVYPKFFARHDELK